MWRIGRVPGTVDCVLVGVVMGEDVRKGWQELKGTRGPM